MNAIDRFTIHQFEQMGRAAFLDEQRIEKLREEGIPKKEAWAIALCDQLASGFMFIAGQWRKPTEQDVFATQQRIDGLKQSLEREQLFAHRLESRRQIAELTANAKTDAERAAVEALLKEGRANPVAIVSEPERLSVEVGKRMDTSARDAAIEDIAEFYPALREGDEGVSFVASERTKIIFEAAHDDGGGEQSIIVNEGDSFKMDRDGNFTITPADGSPKVEGGYVRGTEQPAAVIDSSYTPPASVADEEAIRRDTSAYGAEFQRIDDAAEAARKIEEKAAYVPAGSPGNAPAAAGGVQASEQASEAAGSDSGANGDAGGAVSAASEPAKSTEAAGAGK